MKKLVTAKHKLIAPCVFKPNNKEITPETTNTITVNGWQYVNIVCNIFLTFLSYTLPS